MATDIPLLLGILFSINPNFDNKNKIEDWDKNKETYKEKKDTPDGIESKETLRGSISEFINGEFGNLKICFDKVNIEDLNEVFYTYYSSENKKNTNFTYNNVKEVIALFTNYYNLVNYLLNNDKLDNGSSFVYPYLDNKIIKISEIQNTKDLRDKINLFIKKTRDYFYPLLEEK